MELRKLWKAGATRDLVSGNGRSQYCPLISITPSHSICRRSGCFCYCYSSVDATTIVADATVVAVGVAFGVAAGAGASVSIVAGTTDATYGFCKSSRMGNAATQSAGLSSGDATIANKTHATRHTHIRTHTHTHTWTHKHNHTLAHTYRQKQRTITYT